jgi:dGTPase
MPTAFPRPEFRELYKELLQRNRRRDRTQAGSKHTLHRHALRRRDEKVSDKDNIRPAFFHDTDRIIHCNAYARYIDKTQVFFQAKNDHLTRRVLHVQLVSKIARTMARFLEANEDLVEAIALAHDLGHAPFGHTGEEIIAKILEEKGAGSFAHSAQSVRVLDRLENDGTGLNLTLQVLDGILGHNGEMTKQELKWDKSNLSWESVDANVEKCLTESRKSKPEKHVLPSTLEGAIVRLADVFAYLGRDIEDAIAIGLIARSDLPKEAVEVIGDTNREIINNLVMDVIHHSHDAASLRFSDDGFMAMDSIKRFNYQRIYEAPIIAEQKHRFEKLVRELFDLYITDIECGNEESSIFPQFLSSMRGDYAKQTSTERQVADYVAGMTDRFLLSEYKDRFMPKELDYVIRNP